jgi:superfamily I DNA and/or RNA helicase
MESIKSIDPSEATSELLATADVIFCTLSTAGVSAMKATRQIDDLLVDEAPAATEPELCIPFHLRPKRLLAVGDPMQLPALVKSKYAAAGKYRIEIATGNLEWLTAHLGRLIMHFIHPQSICFYCII